MVGVWEHHSASDAWERVTIKSDGTGKIEWYTNNKLHKDTKEKKWYVEDNRLYLGKVTFSLQPYDINEFPAVCTAGSVQDYDTLVFGTRYCMLNNHYFVEKG